MTLVIGGQRRRRDVVAAAPDLHLRLAVTLDGLRLVQPLERAVVTLVQPPGALHRNPHPIHLIEHDPERADRPLQHRSECDIDHELLLEKLPPGARGLLATLVRKVDVRPAREEVLQVPDALAVADQYQFSGDAHSFLTRAARRS